MAKPMMIEANSKGHNMILANNDNSSRDGQRSAYDLKFTHTIATAIIKAKKERIQVECTLVDSDVFHNGGGEEDLWSDAGRKAKDFTNVLEQERNDLYSLHYLHLQKQSNPCRKISFEQDGGYSYNKLAYVNTCEIDLLKEWNKL